MNKSFMAANGRASPAHVGGNYTKCGQMSMKVPSAGDAIDRGQSRVCKETRGPGCVTTPCQVPRQRPSSTSSMTTVTLRSHQRQWSDDFCICGISSVIIVKKKKEPQPPQRGVTLLRPQKTSHSSFKRYSCPPIGMSASSSSSTSSSCSSPPPVQTSVITGHDPLGWKLQPKSSSSSSRARAKRLSLQIPLPVIPVSNSPNPEASSKTKPALRPKPPRRHNSESSAFLKSLANSPPAVTPEQLCAVHLRSVTFSDEVDDVFGEVTQEQEGATSPPHKIPPPVPEKTAMARQIAQLIAHSRQRYRPMMAKNNKNIYTSAMKPNNKTAAKMAGLHLENGCTSDFPVREESRRLS